MIIGSICLCRQCIKPLVDYFIDNSLTAPYRQDHRTCPAEKCVHCHCPRVTAAVGWAEGRGAVRTPARGPCLRSVVPVAAVPRQWEDRAVEPAAVGVRQSDGVTREMGPEWHSEGPELLLRLLRDLLILAPGSWWFCFILVVGTRGVTF